MRRSRQEIIDLFRACQAKLGRTPGRDAFCKAAKVKPSEVKFYWPRHSALVQEAGAPPNEYGIRLDNDEVFGDYARVCLHLGKIPTQSELRISQRELKTRTHSVYIRDGSIQSFQKNFKEWLKLDNTDDSLKGILGYAGWASAKDDVSPRIVADRRNPEPQLHQFLPGCIQYLDVLARGERPPFELPDASLSMLFERRIGDAFRCLGFEVQQFGQGTGRRTDSIACATRERFALIIDAKLRANGYILGTEDRKFLEYAEKHGAELLKQGFDKLYLVVVGPSFRESDLTQLTACLSKSPIRTVVLLTARALMRMVEESIRERSSFSLAEFHEQIYGNKIISE